MSIISQWISTFSKHKSPWFFLSGVAFSVFVAEVIVMHLLMAFPKLPESVEAFVDGTLLSIFVAPALYYFLYNPLNIENRERAKIEQELRRSTQQLQVQSEQLQEYSQALEEKVAERTQELSLKNHQLEALLAELHTTQAQMIHQEKMSSLGQLVAGVAHEINNPVNFIYGNITHLDRYCQDLLQVIEAYQLHYPNPPEAVQEILEEVELDFVQADFSKLLQSLEVGTDRIRQIVLSLRNFSRLDEADFKAVDLHEGIESTLLILQSRLKACAPGLTIEVVKSYEALPLVQCYPGPLNQVLMNLIANAIDAIEEAKIPAGQIVISTQVISENCVKIAISDNGSGVPENVRSQLFDPFFTTKPAGKGTGLGLSISYQIITKQHHGKLTCNSTMGVETQFVIEIPIFQAA